MFGIKHVKFDPMTYVFHYHNGEILREGRGLSFFYFSPVSSIVAIPMCSNDLPFVFNETTRDYQTVTIQGQISYKIVSPQLLSELLDFTIASNGLHKKNDTEKLNQRIINEAQTVISAFIQKIDLKEAMRSAKGIEEKIHAGLMESQIVKFLGVEVIAANILHVKAKPEMARALETETIEKLQQEADKAIYERRNFAVEQERKIRESELNTEIAVEEKQKQIAEKKMESDVLSAENDRTLREMKIEADISVEQQREALINQRTENDKKEAETQGYVISAKLEPYKNVDWKIVTALNNNLGADQSIALAFRELAENAGKIGTLNISPDLLENLTRGNKMYNDET